MLCIILNTAALAVDWFNSPIKVDNLMEDINIGFAAIFTIEAIIKLLALGPKEYF